MELDRVDRRRLVRMKMPFTIHLHKKNGESVSTYTEDISQEGVKVVIKQKLDVGSELGVEIYLSKPPLVCRGRVIWTKKRPGKWFKKEKFYELGIKLNEINQENQAVLKKRLSGCDK